MKKKQGKSISVDGLARMAAREFAAVRGEMKAGFDGVDKRFDKINEDIGILRKDMDAGFGALAEILKEIRSDLKEVKSDVTTVNLDYTELKTRVERLEKKVGLRP